MEVDGMETENSGIIVLDEGIEETLECAFACCKTSMASLTPPQ